MEAGKNFFQEPELHVLRRIMALLTEDNAARAAMDFARAGSLLKAKLSAADEIARERRDGRLANLTLKLRRDLVDLVETNRKLLKASMAAQNRALDQVARIAKASPMHHSQSVGEYDVRG